MMHAATLTSHRLQRVLRLLRDGRIRRGKSCAGRVSWR